METYKPKPREILISKEQFENMQNQGVSAMPVHNRRDMSAPASYLAEDEGDDGTLAFVSGEEESSEEEAAENDEIDEADADESIDANGGDTPAFLLDDDGPEDDVMDENRILEDIKPAAPAPAKESKPRVFDEEDEGMFFSR